MPEDETRYDMDGNKIKIGSIVKMKPVGSDSYTQKGSVVQFYEEFLEFTDSKKGFRRCVKYEECKRVRWSAPPIRPKRRYRRKK
jgi:hypothetical protein